MKATNTAGPHRDRPTLREIIKTTWLGFTGDFPTQNIEDVKSLGSLRRQTLVSLRWGAIFGQILSLIIVSQLFEFSYPLLACSLTVLTSIVFNLIITLTIPLDRSISDREAFIQLGFDLLQLAGLLWFTGGIVNPFSILFIVPVVMAATTLSKWVVLALGSIAVVLAFGLVIYHHPLPWSPMGGFELPFIFKCGIWVAITVGGSFTSFYTWRSTKESQKMAFALAAVESKLAQEQKLSALGGLAAAAAHELGTPLATIQVVAKEMSLEIEANTPLGEDAALILSQAQRCRDILEKLSRRGDEGDLIHDVLSIEDLLEEAAEPFIQRGKDIIITYSEDNSELILKRCPQILYAMKNYVNNAVDFAESQVELTAQWDPVCLTLFIDDDGEGFSSEIKGRLGQPYVSTRRKAKMAGGLGLGLFISERLIKKLGGEVNYLTGPLGGARIVVILPRDRLPLVSQN